MQHRDHWMGLANADVDKQIRFKAAARTDYVWFGRSWWVDRGGSWRYRKRRLLRIKIIDREKFGREAFPSISLQCRSEEISALESDNDPSKLRPDRSIPSTAYFLLSGYIF